ncbi:sperm flagellar protein 1 [Lepisosteus oculatus]|uniref:sperm flagellar protein 1 n=1 Tax=Lepisosteus oculatus TaxID=7918 RepID=UPI003718BE58
MDAEPGEEVLQDLYAWIDQIPLSRPKRSVARDFSDGVMAAEVVNHFFPRLVELHNYISANSTQQKLSNWGTLNRRVFSKLNFHVPEETVKKIVLSTAGVIEPVLCTLRNKINEKRLGKSMNEKSRTLPQDLEYYSISNEQSQAGYVQVPKVYSYTNEASEQRRLDWTCSQTDRPKQKPSSHVDPAFLLLMEEKEQALLALQETMEVAVTRPNESGLRKEISFRTAAAGSERMTCVGSAVLAEREDRGAG